MREHALTVGGGFGVSDILYPSFVKPLFDVSASGDKAVKRWGHCSGLVLESEPGRVVVKHESRECVEYGEYVVGAWATPRRTTLGAGGGVLSGLLDSMLESYGLFGVSVSPMDDFEVFASIFLSRNTDYERNTVRWVRELLYRYESIEKVAEVDGRELLKTAGSSYQIRQLPRSLRCYSDVREKVARGEHRELLRCANVGPKVYHSYLLHVLLKKDVAPVDVNLSKLLARLGFPLERYKKPEKRYCMRYDCDSCPLSGACLESVLKSMLGENLGWFQNAAYYHYKTHCQTSRCRQCGLRSLCSKS